MNQYAEEAKRLVLTFEPTMARDAIIDLIDYVVARRK
jgi:hypothetical protein